MNKIREGTPWRSILGNFVSSLSFLEVIYNA